MPSRRIALAVAELAHLGGLAVSGERKGVVRIWGTPVEQALFALPVLRALTEKWMAGEPLCKLERVAGTAADKLGTCEIARHFANRVVPDIAFVAGLPARILAARAA